MPNLTPIEIVEMIISGHFGSPETLPGKLSEWPQVRPALTWLVQAVRERDELVYCLPSTGDGQPIYPGRILYWFGDEREVLAVKVQGILPQGAVSWVMEVEFLESGAWRKVDQNDLYSTREVAQSFIDHVLNLATV